MSEKQKLKDEIIKLVVDFALQYPHYKTPLVIRGLELHKLEQESDNQGDSNNLLSPADYRKQTEKLLMFEHYIHIGNCSDEGGWFAYFTPSGEIGDLPDWRVNGCESEDEALHALIEMATDQMEQGWKQFDQMMRNYANGRTQLKINLPPTSPAWNTPIIEEIKRVTTWHLVCDQCEKKDAKSGNHAAALAEAQKDGWLIAPNDKLCPDCNHDFIANCFVCGNPVLHGTARICRPDPAGSDKFQHLHLECAGQENKKEQNNEFFSL